MSHGFQGSKGAPSPLHSECKPLVDFLKSLKETGTSIAAAEKQARLFFPAAQIENRKSLFLTLEFKSSLPCHQLLARELGAPREWDPPPSPPPLGPHQAPIEISDPDDNPYHWLSETYLHSGWEIKVGTDRKRIKSLVVRPPSAR